MLEVPSSLILSTQSAYNSELYPFFAQYVDTFSDKNAAWEDYVLIIYLMFEEAKGDKSKWHYMMDLWPKSVDTFYSWSDAEIKEVQWKRLIKDGIKENGALRDSWEMLVEILSKHPQLCPKKYFNYSNYIRYWSLLGSRIFNSYINTTAFTPYAEFVNHHNANTHYKTLLQSEVDTLRMKPAHLSTSIETSPDNDFDLDDRYETEVDKLETNEGVETKLEVGGNNEFNYEEEIKSIEVLLKETTQSTENAEQLTKIKDAFKKDVPHIQILKNDDQEYEEGSQIFMTYGDHSNMYLLSKYGFIVDNNIFDYAVVEFSEAKKYSNLPIIEDLLRVEFKKATKPLYDMGIKIIYQNVSPKLITFAKILLHIANPRKFVSYDNEKLAIQEAIILLNNTINDFPTNIKEDDELLKVATSYKLKMAIKARMRLKEILLHQITLLNLIIAINNNLCKASIEFNSKQSIEVILTKIDWENEKDVLLNRRMVASYYATYGIILVH
jgi:Rubisco LSMT substrate-binding